MSLPIVFVISDSTGETAENVAKAALRHFQPTQVNLRVISFVNSTAQIELIVQEAKQHRAAIVYTIVNEEMRELLKKRAMKQKIVCLDVLGQVVRSFEQWLGQPSNHELGVFHHLDDDYFRRITAMEFAVQYDDAKDPRGLFLADIVIIGVSRTSKTPLSMYLAYSKKLKVANIPLVPEVVVPPQLFQVPKERVVGLLIQKEKLLDIRKERLVQLGLDESAIYGDMKRIDDELNYARNIMEKIGCEIIDVTNKAVEETASIILDVMKVK